MTLRVLHIGKFFPPDPGGMEVYLADLMHAQRAHGLDAHALVHGTPRPDDPPWLTRVPVMASVLYVPLAPGFALALAAALKRVEPDVLHLHMPNAAALLVLGLADARRIPWVIHWHSDVVNSRLKGRIALAYRGYRPFEQALLARAARIVATSPDYLQASDALAAWRDKCDVVPLGLEASRLPTPEALSMARARARAYWPEGTLRLMSVGRLTYYKGFETLVRAVQAVAGVHLVIVGEGEERSSLEAMVASLCAGGEVARVTLAGGLDDEMRSALLAECDLFCLASRERTEAFGIAVMEAMRYARPCLVSALPGSGLPWLVLTSGAGETVTLDDVAAWQQAIVRLKENPALRTRYGEAGYQAFIERFGIDVSSKAMLKTYISAGVEWFAADLEVRSAVAPVGLVPCPELSEVSSGGVLVVIPARNEAESIASVIASLQDGGWHHIVVVDDQSTDETAQLARQAGAIVLQPILPLGAWGAMQAGIRYAVRKGYRQVITIDADGQHEPACIPALLEAARWHDVVIGAFPERGSWARRLAWRYFQLLTGFSIEDITSGFRCYNREACEILADEEATLLDYQDLGVLLLLRSAGLEIVEVPVEMYPRLSGPSRIFTSWSRIARYMLESTLLCIARWHPRHQLKRLN